MTETDELLILTRRDLASALDGCGEIEVIEMVRAAYVAHARRQTALPHSTFLRFPGRTRERIIALPAFLGDGFEAAGLKWVSSFPDNVSRGLERASALVILNSMETGRPRVVMEGALVSAMRTAASAALAAQVLHAEPAPVVGLIGAGRISAEIARFVEAVFPNAVEWWVYDLDRARAEDFRSRLARPGRDMHVAPSIEDVLVRCGLVSFATTAVEPHVSDLSMCPRGTTILHVSLRDLTPSVILAADNVVDDVDHVCRAQTSVHLAEQQVGHRDFMRAELGQILTGEAPARPDPDRLTIFSPFGLGILDVAVAARAAAIAERRELGTTVERFQDD
jgi:N-[(2S)-2-amino-2-carboxyethyl]-L-glutamate dehydrogenase